MKNFKKQIWAIFIFLIISVGSYAQDIIVLKNGKEIDCTIKELSDTNIKYIEIADANQVVFNLSRGQVREIKFSYGKVIEEKSNVINELYFYDDRRSNLKVNFYAIGRDALIFTYERSINLYSSWEVTTKFLGLGFTDDGRESGMGLDIGYKFKLNSLFNGTNYRPDHLLHGSYLRGALGIAATDKESFQFYGNNKMISRTLVHFGLDFGKQWIIHNNISLDLFAGIHYYGKVGKDSNFNAIGIDDVIDDAFRHGDITGIANRAISFGIRVGFLFEKNKNISKNKRRK